MYLYLCLYLYLNLNLFIRYTRLADWDYIGQARSTVSIPVFGNGDVMNFEDYNVQKERSGVSGIMLARGALIKPWVFTEIKEQRHWDISAQERLDMVKNFCNYGLEHWGSDEKGVETTRRFLLEWLSFTYRYVPHGICLFPPQHTVIRIGRIIVYCTNGNPKKEQLPGDNRVKQGFN